MAEIEKVKLPDLTDVYNSVGSMLRNCLIVKNERLKEIDFNHLEMVFEKVVDELDHVTGEVKIKPGSENTYRLDTYQFFNYERLDTDVALSNLGIIERTFPKEQYSELAELLNTYGSFTVVSGSIGDVYNEAEVKFQFGNKRNSNEAKSYTVSLGDDEIVKEHYALPFKGEVIFTFVGKDIPNQDDDLEDIEVDKHGAIEIAPFFFNKNLPNPFKRVTKE